MKHNGKGGEKECNPGVIFHQCLPTSPYELIILPFSISCFVHIPRVFVRVGGGDVLESVGVGGIGARCGILGPHGGLQREQAALSSGPSVLREGGMTVSSLNPDLSPCSLSLMSMTYFGNPLLSEKCLHRHGTEIEV